ncbi:MAG: hypothetical protein AB1696_27405 [Planctomycetota bacterium]
MCLIIAGGIGARQSSAQDGPRQAEAWKIGRPIVTYWAGPALTDATARQMAEGGWNMVWCKEQELDVVHRHGLRALLHEPALLSPRAKSLDDPEKKAKLDVLIERVRNHPALYAYYLQDEPNASDFPALGRLVAYLRERDPAHLAYINLFPTYANNKQLGNEGDTVAAYREHLNQFVAIVKPDLISYDHYHFCSDGQDGDQYFLNLGMIRRAALDAGLPFLNIVQACSWTPKRRVPNGDELRWLTYTSLAYGAQGLSHYVYCHPKHVGAMANADGTTTPLYDAAKSLNREFEAIAAELQPLRSLGAYHVGMTPPGVEPLPADAAFRLDPPVAPVEFKSLAPVEGFALGFFGKAEGGGASRATHVVVVNLDYKRGAATAVVGPGALSVFDPSARTWSPAGGPHCALDLPPGGGKLLRLEERGDKRE